MQPKALFADAPGVPSVPPPPTCPYHPTFLSRSAPADTLAVLEVGEHSSVFFFCMVHQLEVLMDGTVDEATAINFAISTVAPPHSPHDLVASSEHGPRVAQGEAVPPPGVWSIVCPCDCEVYPL